MKSREIKRQRSIIGARDDVKAWLFANNKKQELEVIPETVAFPGFFIITSLFAFEKI